MIVDGIYHKCVVTSTGSIQTWGDHGCGLNDVLPRLLPDLRSKDVICVSAGKRFTACVTKAGEVFTWGEGQCGKLGHGDRNTSNQKIPNRVEVLIGVKARQISCGWNHTFCTEDGRVYAFGRGGVWTIRTW